MAKAKKEKTLPEHLGCVLYVDGGCRPGYPSDPNAKFGGWGMHGYTYELDVKPASKRTKKDVPTIAGYQIGDKVEHEQQVIPLNYIDGFGSMTDKDRSDIAELTGFKQAVELVKEKGYKKVQFLLDNQYVIDGANQHFDKWCAAGWKKPNGDPYANQALWESIMSVYLPLKYDVDMKIDWVNGHSGNLGNDRADYLATKGVYFGRNGKTQYANIQFSPVAKYRDPKPNINRLFMKNRWYFNTDHIEPLMSKDGRYVYHCGAHGPDDTLVGKPMADSVAYVVYTKDKQTVLENIRLRHAALIDNPLNELCMARLDTILLPRIYDELERDGMDCLSIAPRRLRFQGLCTIDEQEVTRIIQPSGLTFKLIDVHNSMCQSLDDFIESHTDANGQLKPFYTDITERFYRQDKDKKGNIVYNMAFEPTNKSLRIPLNVALPQGDMQLEATFTVGIDMPSRELINAIKEHRPQVIAKTWPLSEFAFRYALIFVVGDDIMMWMGKDSNLQFVYPDAMKRNLKK